MYGNDDDRAKTSCNDVVPLNSHFHKAGYEVLGAGKIYHGDGDQWGPVIGSPPVTQSSASFSGLAVVGSVLCRSG